MKNKVNVSRRSFLKTSSIGLGAGLAATSGFSCTSSNAAGRNKSPREVCLASVDLRGLWPEKTIESRIKRIIERMEDVTGLNPDVICIPELYNTMWVNEEKTLAELAEDEKAPGTATSVIADFAKKHNCYVTCPTITKNEGHYYNSSLLIDRKGNIAGVYHKIHTVKSETLPGVDYKDGSFTPGALDQPVIDTDFGRVGMQICYDANWSDGWDNLKKNGAEIVLFSSAFPGGRILNYYAWKNGYYIMSATGNDARIIDMSGNDIDTSSTFVRYAWGYANLEKVCTPVWPTRDMLPELFRKYGEKLEIKVWDSTEVITIASRDAGLKVADILREYKIQSNDVLVAETEEVQNKYRL